ncbi:MAG: arsenate reductase (glutaredoxin) [Gammaproteobacteria bacterium]|nr:arsenate reductase (glutaredoxin) [Gammaproteobacteria bacterium]
MSVVIYHNPKCTKSRQTLALIEARGIEPRIVDYLSTPPSRAELERILKLLKIEPRALMRSKEPEYKRARLDNPALTRAALIKAMHDHPKLIERPIVLANGKAVIGRPPENVLKIL